VAKQILLVDDEVAICEALTAFLAEQGHQVRYATNGEGAVAQALHADLAICDLRLGSENALDVIERLRRVRPDLEILADLEAALADKPDARIDVINLAQKLLPAFLKAGHLLVGVHFHGRVLMELESRPA